MPSLVHESFLVLLLDPYVIVHRAAIRALRDAASEGSGGRLSRLSPYWSLFSK